MGYGGVRGAFQHPAGGLQLGTAALVLEPLLRLGTLAALARAHRILMARPAESSATAHMTSGLVPGLRTR